jgi:predicted kinase
LPRPKVILLVGLPGSGKSTYAARHNFPVLSSDSIRKLLLDDVTDQSINRRIFIELRRLLRLRLELRRPVTCIDATNLTPAERRPYIKIAQMHDADAEAVFFDVPVEVCKRRNSGRPRVVPEDVLERMAARLRPPTLDEGFTRVTDARSAPARDAAPEATPDPEPA